MTHYTYAGFRDLLDMEHKIRGQEGYLPVEFLEMALEVVRALESNWFCFSCGIDCFREGEDYYVQDELWRKYGVDSQLCIGCLETRVGRQLTPEDFLHFGEEKYTEEEVKRVHEWRESIGYSPSDRLIDRCGGEYAGNDGYR